MMHKSQDELFREGEALYEKYAKPLEDEHWGEFIAVAPDGSYILGDDLREVSLRALRELGPGAFVFRVGERSVGKIR